MKKYIITISIAVLAVIGIGVGLGIGLNKRNGDPITFEQTKYKYDEHGFLDLSGPSNPFYPFDQYHHHIQRVGPDYGYRYSRMTAAEKHYQDLLDEGHQDVDNDNQLKYNY